jgi:hypothetical protein
MRCGLRSAGPWYWRGKGACQVPRRSDPGGRRGGEEQEKCAWELSVVEGRRVSGVTFLEHWGSGGVAWHDLGWGAC